jgi:glycosyltransferase involved in cell wall biosynthesis
MLDLDGSIRPAIVLVEALMRKGFDVELFSPLISPKVSDRLKEMGVNTLNLNIGHFASLDNHSMLWFEAWLKESLFRSTSKKIAVNNEFLINFSNQVVAPSVFWYLQGPPSIAVKDMLKEFPVKYQLMHYFTKNVIDAADRKIVEGMNKNSQKKIANSNFCASMYTKFKITVDDVIYPPLDIRLYRPSTSNPSSDYVLTYFGKETDYSVIKQIADKGVKIRAFGSKDNFSKKELIGHPNVQVLGRLKITDLIDSYSNALFTLFPFTHEPFGYIPVESIACGTPVLTYNKQGPGEYLQNNSTGWLVNGKNEMIETASKVWENGYPSILRGKGVKYAQHFSTEKYLEKWFSQLNFLDS